MNSHDPIFIAPPITEIPDYVWSRQYDKSCFLPGKPVLKPKEEGRRISHSDAETALQAAKRACRASSARWFGRSSSQADATEFLVYEDGKVVPSGFWRSLALFFGLMVDRIWPRSWHLF